MGRLRVVAPGSWYRDMHLEYGRAFFFYSDPRGVLRGPTFPWPNLRWLAPRNRLIGLLVRTLRAHTVITSTGVSPPRVSRLRCRVKVCTPTSGRIAAPAPPVSLVVTPVVWLTSTPCPRIDLGPAIPSRGWRWSIADFVQNGTDVCPGVFRRRVVKWRQVKNSIKTFVRCWGNVVPCKSCQDAQTMLWVLDCRVGCSY